MVHKKYLVWIFTLSVVFVVHAQNGDEIPPVSGLSPVTGILPLDEARENEVFAPFVSQLEGEIRNNLIRLSWKDARDIQGPVFIYRSETPFSPVGMLPAPVELPYGTGAYLDEVENPGILYYFVAASDEWGRKYILPILNTNTLSITIEPENVPGYITRLNQNARQVPVLPPNIPVPGIEGLNVRIDQERVIITFAGADYDKNLILYRSLTPIRRQEDLLSAIIIRQRVSSPVIDYPLPGIDYHYALIYEEDIVAGLLSIRQGQNATGAVQIAVTGRSGAREMPLPGLNLSTSPVAGATSSGSFPGFISESPGFEASAFSLERRNEKTAKKEIEVFPEDLERSAGSGGDEYQLRLIVQGYFSLKEWDKAREELRRFLDLPRASDFRARAHYYLGQVYYFQGKPREALFEFLSSQEQYPQNTNSWIQAVLEDFTRY